MIATKQTTKSVTSSLPNGWQWVTLGSVCSFIRGVTFNKADAVFEPRPGYSPILRAGNVGNELDLENDLIWVSDTFIAKDSWLQPGDIVICMSSGSASVVGKTAVLNNPWNGSVGAFCGIIRTTDPYLKEYISFWLRSHHFISWRDLQARGANIQNLRFSQFENIKIPLPPRKDIDRLVNLLKSNLLSIKKATAAAEAQLEAAKALPAAYLREVFSSPEAQKWPRKKLGEICEFIGGMQPAKGFFQNELKPGYVRLVQIQDFRIDDMAVYIPKELAKRNFDVDDVMIGRYGPPIFQILRGLSGAYNVALIKAVPRGDITKDYLYYLLQEPGIQKAVIDQSQRSAGQSGVNKRFLEKLLVPRPSVETQERIVNLLKDKFLQIEKLANLANEKLQAVNRMSTALLRQAFNGEL